MSYEPYMQAANEACLVREVGDSTCSVKEKDGGTRVGRAGRFRVARRGRIRRACAWGQSAGGRPPPPFGQGFDRIGTRAYTDGMKVNLTPELQAKLDRLAAQQGRDTESLVHEAVERLVGYDEWFIRQVEKGLAQIDRGEVLEHEEVAARMEKRDRKSTRLNSSH